MSKPVPGFLHAEDLQKDGNWKRYTMQVERVHEPGTVQFENGQRNSMRVVEFKGASKRWHLNKTNTRILMTLFGDVWVGKKITLYPVETMFGKEWVTGIRVAIPPDRRYKPKFGRNDVELTGPIDPSHKPPEVPKE